MGFWPWFSTKQYLKKEKKKKFVWGLFKTWKKKKAFFDQKNHITGENYTGNWGKFMISSLQHYSQQNLSKKKKKTLKRELPQIAGKINVFKIFTVFLLKNFQKFHPSVSFLPTLMKLIVNPWKMQVWDSWSKAFGIKWNLYLARYESIMGIDKNRDHYLKHFYLGKMNSFILNWLKNQLPVILMCLPYKGKTMTLKNFH